MVVSVVAIDVVALQAVAVDAVEARLQRDQQPGFQHEAVTRANVGVNRKCD